MAQQKADFNKYYDKATIILENLKRHLLLVFRSDNPIINKNEMRIISLRRSGTHAIINWLLAHYGNENEIGIDKDICFFNNTPPKTNFYRYFAQFYSKKLLGDVQGKFKGRYLLSYNYENACLKDIVNPLFEINHDIYFGKSQNRYDILILRDPFNTMASIYQGLITGKRIYSKVHFERKNITQLWIDYAKEFLGETNYLKHKKILVNYNKWFLNQDYRRKISKELGVNFTDKNLEKISHHGGGSSFEGTESNGKSQQMRVMERWKMFINDPQYLSMFNEEVLYYSGKIFGSIDESKVLLSKIV